MLVIWKVALFAFVFLTSLAFLLSTVAFFMDIRRKSRLFSHTQAGTGTDGRWSSSSAGYESVRGNGDRLYRGEMLRPGLTYRMRTRKYIYTPQGFVERT